MKNKVNPYAPIGPETKRESKKSERKGKITPPLSATGSAEMKAAKKKRVIQGAAAIGSAVIGTIGTIAADARLRRGSLRIQDRDMNVGGYQKQPTTREKWDAGRNKKSTKR